MFKTCWADADVTQIQLLAYRRWLWCQWNASPTPAPNRCCWRSCSSSSSSSRRCKKWKEIFLECVKCGASKRWHGASLYTYMVRWGCLTYIVRWGRLTYFVGFGCLAVWGRLRCNYRKKACARTSVCQDSSSMKAKKCTQHRPTSRSPGIGDHLKACKDGSLPPKLVNHPVIRPHKRIHLEPWAWNPGQSGKLIAMAVLIWALWCTVNEILLMST